MKPLSIGKAGRLDPTTLRSLDALHTATALNLGDDLDAMVTYDERLGLAANSNGIAVIAPREDLMGNTTLT